METFEDRSVYILGNHLGPKKNNQRGTDRITHCAYIELEIIQPVWKYGALDRITG